VNEVNIIAGFRIGSLSRRNALLVAASPRNQ
jgi:hypothetical protein